MTQHNTIYIVFSLRSQQRLTECESILRCSLAQVLILHLSGNLIYLCLILLTYSTSNFTRTKYETFAQLYKVFFQVFVVCPNNKNNNNNKNKNNNKKKYLFYAKTVMLAVKFIL